MQLRPLKIFCDVVDRRSFTAAADENGLSQSAASQTVRQLEKQVGTPLLDRSRRPFVLTPEGKAFYEGCRRILRDFEALLMQVRSLHDAIAGRLTVAAIYSVGLAHMRQYVQQFRTLHPNASVRLEYLHPDRVYEVVENGGADLGLVSYPQSSRTIEFLPWRKEKIVIACAPDHPLANRQSAPLESLSGETLIGFERGLRIREEIDRELARRQTQVERGPEFDNIETIKQAVEIGDGVALLPEPTVERERAAGTLATVNLEGDELVRPLGILHRRQGELSAATKEFIDLLIPQDGIEVNGQARPPLFKVHRASAEMCGSTNSSLSSSPSSPRDLQ
jgi:DNA-binding transcriptional LysR family regulator